MDMEKDSDGEKDGAKLDGKPDGERPDGAKPDGAKLDMAKPGKEDTEDQTILILSLLTPAQMNALLKPQSPLSWMSQEP